METLGKKPKVKSLGSLSGKRIWIDKITTAIFFLGDVDIQVDEDAKLILEIKIDSDTDDAKVDFRLEAEFDDSGEDGSNGGVRKRISVNSDELGEDGENVIDLLTVRLKDVGLKPIVEDDGEEDDAHRRKRKENNEKLEASEAAVDEDDAEDEDEDENDADESCGEESEDDEVEEEDEKDDKDDDKDHDKDDDAKAEKAEKTEPIETRSIDTKPEQGKPATWIVEVPSGAATAKIDTSALPGWLNKLISAAESVEIVTNPGAKQSASSFESPAQEAVESGKSGEEDEQSTVGLRPTRPAWVFPYGDGISYTVRREL